MLINSYLIERKAHGKTKFTLKIAKEDEDKDTRGKNGHSLPGTEKRGRQVRFMQEAAFRHAEGERLWNR